MVTMVVKKILKLKKTKKINLKKQFKKFKKFKLVQKCLHEKLTLCAKVTLYAILSPRAILTTAHKILYVVMIEIVY